MQRSEAGYKVTIEDTESGFVVTLDGTYLAKHDLDTGVRVIHGRGNTDLAGFTSTGYGGVNPIYRGVASVSWTNADGFGATAGLRYVGTVNECGGKDTGLLAGASTCWVDDRYQRTVAAWTSLDIGLWASGTTALGKTKLALGMRNVLDTPPPAIYASFVAPYDPLNYDVIGRYYWTRLTHAF